MISLPSSQNHNHLKKSLVKAEPVEFSSDMNGGEKWRMIRGAGTAQDKMVINQIMLRFRPIAPKPASDASDSDLCSLNNKHLLLSKQRTKRKYVRVRKINRFVKRNQNSKVSPSSPSDRQKEKSKGTNVLTLQLLPETSSYSTEEEPLVDKERSRCNPDNNLFNNQSENNNQLLKLKQAVIDEAQISAVKIAIRSVVIVESWVTIECVTDTNQACTDGFTDVERLKNLEEDENPGFISDGSNKVKWVNEAYKKMMEEEEKGRAVEIMVRLVREEKLVPYMHKSAFTCWVRLSKEKEMKEKHGSKMVPCDVWRMESGGLAWRLDVEAALSLGR